MLSFDPSNLKVTVELDHSDVAHRLIFEDIHFIGRLKPVAFNEAHSGRDAAESVDHFAVKSQLASDVVMNIVGDWFGQIW